MDLINPHLGLKTDGLNPDPSHPVFYISPAGEPGTEVIGIVTETGEASSRPFFWDPVFCRKCPIFDLYFLNPG
jgi:hypothetical protein